MPFWTIKLIKYNVIQEIFKKYMKKQKQIILSLQFLARTYTSLVANNCGYNPNIIIDKLRIMKFCKNLELDDKIIFKKLIKVENFFAHLKIMCIFKLHSFYYLSQNIN